VVLLRADPGEHSEAGSFKALEGKKWNHPMVVGDKAVRSKCAGGSVLSIDVGGDESDCGAILRTVQGSTQRRRDATLELNHQSTHRRSTSPRC